MGETSYPPTCSQCHLLIALLVNQPVLACFSRLSVSHDVTWLQPWFIDRTDNPVPSWSICRSLGLGWLVRRGGYSDSVWLRSFGRLASGNENSTPSIWIRKYKIGKLRCFTVSSAEGTTCGSMGCKSHENETTSIEVPIGMTCVCDAVSCRPLGTNGWWRSENLGLASEANTCRSFRT